MNLSLLLFVAIFYYYTHNIFYLYKQKVFYPKTYINYLHYYLVTHHSITPNMSTKQLLLFMAILIITTLAWK